MRPGASPHPLRLLLLAIAGTAVLVAFTATPMGFAAGKGNSHGRQIFGIAVGGDIAAQDSVTRRKELNAIAAARARWIRIDINWAQIQAAGPSTYDWEAVDKVVKGATARGLKVLGVINFTPAWARPAGTTTTHGPDPAPYAAFAQKAAKHYSAMGVHAYEVWNEPNNGEWWTPKPNPVAYTALLKAAYPAIKRADSRATVLTGGTSPALTNGTNYWPTDWLAAIYANGGGRSFDAVSHHPSCIPAMPGDREPWSAWHLMYGSTPRYSGGGGEGGGRSMRSLMIANGDREKRIWGTEFGAATGGPTAASEGAQARTIRKGYSLWKNYRWAGPLFTYEIRDEGTDPGAADEWWGLLRYDFTRKPAFRAYRKAASGGS